MKKNILLVVMGIVAGASISARKWFADTREKVSNVFRRRKSPGANLRELGKRPDMGSKFGRKVLKGDESLYQRGRRQEVALKKYKKGRKLTPKEKVMVRIKYEQNLRWDPVKEKYRK